MANGIVSTCWQTAPMTRLTFSLFTPRLTAVPPYLYLQRQPHLKSVANGRIYKVTGAKLRDWVQGTSDKE